MADEAHGAGNLFFELPDARGKEISRVLLSHPHLTIERIVSHGQATPEGEWYDQDTDEWVLVLSGEARLLIEGESADRQMRAGDYVFLAAHVRHRVTWTDPDRPTVWLAVHAAGSPR